MIMPMGRISGGVWVVVWLLAVGGSGWAAPRPGKAILSDGQVLEGKVSTTPGKQIRLYVTDKDVRNFDLERVVRMEFAPSVEKMQQKYVKGEMGRGQDPILKLDESYPLREFQVHVEMLDGKKMSGRFGTSVFYVETGAGTKKYVVERKQTGKVGQKLEEMVYLKAIEFSAPDAAPATEQAAAQGAAPTLDAAGRILVRVQTPEATGAGVELFSVSDGMVRLKPEPAGESGSWKMDYPVGEGAWFVLKTGNRLLVGWPGGQARPEGPAGEALFSLVGKFLAEEPNFFDQRDLVAVWRNPDQRDMVYSLVILTRKAKKQWADQPWRLSIWKWKYDADGQTMHFLKEGMFFRLRDTSQETPPEVVLSEGLSRVERGSAAWVVGGGR